LTPFFYEDQIAETSRKINRELKKYNVRLEAEIFFFDAGKRTNGGFGDKREKGSMGLDVILTNTITREVVLAFDLKTGKSGTARGKLPGYKKRHNNAPIIDVFVNRRK
jgi:hypothetical protein